MSRIVTLVLCGLPLLAWAGQESERTPGERVKREQAEREAQRMDRERAQAQQPRTADAAPAPGREETPEQRMIRVDELAKQRGLTEAQRAQLYREEQAKAEAARAAKEKESRRR